MQSTFAPMSSYIEENGMKTAEGFKRGNRKRQCHDFWDLPLIEAKNFKPYYVASHELPVVNFDDFECTVKNNREIFQAPHLIIKQSHKNGRFLSEVLDYDAVFNHSLLGVHGGNPQSQISQCNNSFKSVLVLSYSYKQKVACRRGTN